MSRKAPRPNRQILEEASTWFVAFRNQDHGENTRQEFHQWLKRSPEHIRAYLEIAVIYADIPTQEHGHTPAELIARARSSPDLNILSWSRGDSATDSPKRIETSRGVRQRSFWPRVALAASILVFAFVGVWFHAMRNTYGTGIGEQRSITMPDGSIIDLNANSKVRVAFDDRRRNVELLEGQALFRVAKDRDRPFVVHAGAMSVRAVGTRFDVNRKSTGTTVTVLEGRVAVLSRTAETEAATASGAAEAPLPAPPRVAQPDAGVASRAATIQAERQGEVLLAAGEQITVTPTHARKSASPNIAAATAWTQHQLVFDGTPLSEVLEEFSRYTRQRLVIDTPALADLKISGQYTSTSPDSLLRFLSLQPGVVVTRADGETHIRQE